MSCCIIDKDSRRISHCKKCGSCPSNFEIRTDLFWQDAELICKCGNKVGYIYCMHCVKTRLKNIPAMVIEWAEDRPIMATMG